ncbi:MAG: PKD domain-containing protein [Candidatus Omnitrophica bacterium]|nr:PKD domain-containing protein [Candidatus Omnitrophota bacterium]
MKRLIIVLGVFAGLVISGILIYLIYIGTGREQNISTEGCTAGVAHGSVTVDGRPLYWRVSDSSEDKRFRFVCVSGSQYKYIGFRADGDGIYNGLNEAGLVLGNTSVSTPKMSTVSPTISPYRYVLEKCNSVEQIKNYIQQEINANRCYLSGCFPVIDAKGNAVIFEINRSKEFRVYDSMDTNRQAQGLLGIVVRANGFHERKDGTDDTNIKGRYKSGIFNILGLRNANMLSIETIIQGAGSFEVVRYGPGRQLATIARGSRKSEEIRSLSAMVIHGVASGEDPALTTMWVIAGQPNYGIAVPAWVRVSDIPQCLKSGEMYDRAMSLYEKGREKVTQASIFPAERHMLNIVANIFLPYWRVKGVPSVEEMTRIEHRMANDAYSVLDCLDRRNAFNIAPSVKLNASASGLTVNFEVTAKDPDGTLVSTEWNFGDGQTSIETSPTHTYAAPGTYLVSCTVMDYDKVTITDWKYLSVFKQIEQ